MNSAISLFMTLAEGREIDQPSGVSAGREQTGEKMCLGFRERECEREPESEMDELLPGTRQEMKTAAW